jgi:hypothetical protein
MAAATNITQRREGNTLVTSAHLRGVSAGSLIALLHTPSRLLPLSADITAFEPLPSSPNSYKLTLRVPLFFGFHINGTATAQLAPSDTGLVTEVEAGGAGTLVNSVTRSTWVVEEKEGGCDVREVFEVLPGTTWGCAWFVMMTAGGSHRKLVERFVEAAAGNGL